MVDGKMALLSCLDAKYEAGSSGLAEFSMKTRKWEKKLSSLLTSNKTCLPASQTIFMSELYLVCLIHIKSNAY